MEHLISPEQSAGHLSSSLTSAARRILLSFLLIALVRFVGTCIYRLYFHPLSKFPGPFYRAAFTLPYFLEQFAGKAPYNWAELHLKYGPVVRTSPEKLSFTGSAAWKDIHGFRGNKRQIPKDYKRFVDWPLYLPLFNSNDADHARLRRLVAHAFSDSALREQEPYVQEHYRGLLAQLDTIVSEGAARIDLNHWMDMVSFDVITDMTYGESFEGVRTGVQHQYIREAYTGCKLTPVLLMSWDYSIARWAIRRMVHWPSVQAGIRGTTETASQKFEKRLRQEGDRKDFMSYILPHVNDEGTSKDELINLTNVFLAAGGEETATMMAGLVFYLSKYSDWRDRVTSEIRARFANLEQIRNQDLTQLPCLNAVIQEVYRMRPPGSGHFPRRTTQTEIIDGYVVPPDTSIEVAAYASAHSPMNFADPESFCPERWLPSAPEKYQRDDKGALQPFAVGPRSCIGKNLVGLQNRLMCAYMLWSYDMELCSESRDWDRQQPFMTVWHRPPMYITLKRRTF